MSLKKKSVLITGSTKRTGYGIAAEFVKLGANVFVNGRHGVEVKQAAWELESMGPGRAVPLAADLTRQDEVEAIFSRIAEQGGGLDILINNACNQGLGHSFLDTTLTEWEAVMAVNLRGLFLCCQAAARQMKQSGGGTIINLGSFTASRAIRNRTAYITTKGGIESFTRALAIDLASYKITVNCLAPGYIHTERWDQLPPETVAGRNKNIPLRRGAAIEEVARAAVFMASPAAAYMTGQVLYFDGGCLAQLLPEDAEV
jgi:NAD(P)-dependent dehydrogenase (short-subunit alcohol dehydrogenase family)